jgi:two-component system alkaline phosphatase synthesis response regulator PhoP
MKEQKTILVIEDSAYLAESLADMLNLKGHLPILANGGKDGVEKALENHPDLILLDIRLPDIDGYEVFRQIKNSNWGKSAKILILTASESIDNIARNIDLPRDKILFKPEWSVSALLERIGEALAE